MEKCPLDTEICQHFQTIFRTRHNLFSEHKPVEFLNLTLYAAFRKPDTAEERRAEGPGRNSAVNAVV